MADTPETGSTLDGLFKRRYVDSTEFVVPYSSRLQRDIKFDSANKIGEDYRANLMLRNPQGFTYNGGATYGNPFSLNNALAGASKQASVKGCEIVMKEVISYGLVSRSASGEAAAFDPAMDDIVRGMIESHSNRIEAMTLYGGDSLGAVSSVGGSGTAGTAVITTATWAPGLWSGLEGCELDAYDSTLTTKRNTNGPIVLSNVNLGSLTLSLTYAAGADRTAVGAGDVFVPVGSNGSWSNGIYYLISQSAAGTTVFGLSPATYGLMRSSTTDLSSAALTFAKLTGAVAKPVVRGGMADMTAYVSVYTWIDLMNAEAALRRYASDNSAEFVNGADSIEFYSVNGKLRIVPHTCVKASHAFILNTEDWRRIGSSEPTFNLPGSSPNMAQFIQQESTSASFSIRRWSDTGLFCRRLARQTMIYGITNTTTVG